MITIVTYKDSQPSKEWHLPLCFVQKHMKAFEHIDETCIDSRIFLQNITDDILRYILMFLHLQDRQQISRFLYNMDRELLYKLFNACDYLQVETLQELIGELIAKDMNNKDMDALKEACDKMCL